MGAAGGAVYMGQACHMLAQGLKEALATFGKVGFHKGLPTVKDVPLLIKALSVNASDVADEAHAGLVWLSGRDLGRAPGPWLRWWRKHGAELARREALENAARDLFLNLKRDVLTGRWETVYPKLSARLRGRVAPEELRGFLLSSASLLRRVYRDASVREVRAGEARAVLAVDWGQLGFDFTELALVREGGAWKFDRPPWGKRTVRRVAEVRQTALIDRPESQPLGNFGRGRRRARPAAGLRRRRRSPLRGLFGDLLIGLSFVAVPAGLWFIYPLAAVALPILIFPIAFGYVLFFGKFKSSRRIREELRRMRE